MFYHTEVIVELERENYVFDSQIKSPRVCLIKNFQTARNIDVTIVVYNSTLGK